MWMFSLDTDMIRLFSNIEGEEYSNTNSRIVYILCDSRLGEQEIFVLYVCMNCAHGQISFRCLDMDA